MELLTDNFQSSNSSRLTWITTSSSHWIGFLACISVIRVFVIKYLFNDVVFITGDTRDEEWEDNKVIVGDARTGCQWICSTDGNSLPLIYTYTLPNINPFWWFSVCHIEGDVYSFSCISLKL